MTADRITERMIDHRRCYAFRFLGSDSRSSKGPGVILLEDGRPLTPLQNTADLSRFSAGAYARQDDLIFFLTSDNANPLRNGKHYEVRYTPWTKARHQRQYLSLLGLGLVLLVLYVFRAPLVNVVRRAAPQPESSVSPGMRRSQLAPTLWAIAIVAVTFFAILTPVAFDLGFAGDDWNHIFTRMDGRFLSDFAASWRFFLSMQRPTPLQSLAMATLHKLFGAEPGGYFLCAYAAMGICALLIGVVVRQITRNNLAAFAAAVAWLVIPIKNQALYSINAGTGKWQGSIYIVLSILFYYWSLTRPARKRWACASALLYVFAMLCYEQAVPILPVYIIMEWFWSRRRFPLRLVFGGYWLHVVATVVFVIVRIVFLDASNAKAYHIDNSFLSTPWPWLKSLPNSPEVRWYCDHYRDAVLASFSWEVLRQPNSICLFVGILLAGGLLLRVRNTNAEAPRRPLSEAARAHLAFALLALALFVAPQAFLLFLSASPEERMLVFSSIGLAFLVGQAFGLIDSAFAALRLRPVVRVGGILLIVILAVGGACMGTRIVQAAAPYAEAGRVTRTVYSQLEQAGGTVKPDQQVVIIGTPWLVRNRAFAFSADYAIKGCARSALHRPVQPEWWHGAFSMVPTLKGYDPPQLRSHPEMSAYVQNYFTVKDRGDQNAPWTPYKTLALFVFNGRRLLRVNTLHFQDIDGAWHDQELADVPTGIDFRFPRIATLVDQPELMPSARAMDLKLSAVELVSFGMARDPNLMDTYHVQLVWKKLRPAAFHDMTRLFVHVQTADGGILWSYVFPLDEKELARQLEDHEWLDGKILQQDFLVCETSGVTQGDWQDRVGGLRFVLQSVPADSQGQQEVAESIWTVRPDLTLMLEEKKELSPPS